jgi:hypothetical protein
MLGDGGIGVGFWEGAKYFSLLYTVQTGSEGCSPRLKAEGAQRRLLTTIQDQGQELSYTSTTSTHLYVLMALWASNE